jgi:predicted transcriptional regulator
MRTYPIPGTMASDILAFIIKNPGCSVSGIHRKLGLNPRPARTCIAALAKHGMIEDRPTQEGHSYYPTLKA